MGERDATIGIPVTTGLGRNASEEAGYYGITVIDDIFDGFWMKSAYRIPDTPCNCVEPGTAEGDHADQPLHRALVHHQRRRRREAEGRATPGSRASPSTAAAASRTSPSRSMGARAGCQPGSARILANTRSASGRCR
jgi:hypothetical protein